MKKTNPIFIPRNHKVEEALENANKNNFQHLNDLLDVVIKNHIQIMKI